MGFCLRKFITIDLENMDKELSLEKLFSDIILFFIRNKYLITSITITGILSVILFQKLKPFFKTNATIFRDSLREV